MTILIRYTREVFYDIRFCVLDNILESYSGEDQVVVGEHDSDSSIDTEVKCSLGDGVAELNTDEAEDLTGHANHEDRSESPGIVMTNDSSFISEYERIRMRNIAERDAEFKRLYPSFEDEMRILKAKKTKKVKSKEQVVPLLPTRSSNRIRCRVPNSELNGHGDRMAVTGDADGCASDESENIYKSQNDQGSRDDGMHDICVVEPCDPSGDGVEIVLPDGLSDQDLVTEHRSLDKKETLTNEETQDEYRGKFSCIPCDMIFR